MKTFRNLLPFAAVLAIAPLAPAAVPSGINYQGRLTNASGVPQAGNRTMSLKIYDAATSGTQLYAESIGSVTVDANGVYGFQFGASGTSNTLVTETLATTDGTTLTYQKTLSNTPAIAGTASVTDGTYSWNETTGNPGSPAAATAITVSGFVVGATVTSGGSGYTSPPTVTITGNGTGATATATVSSGAVSGITINSTGSGYTTGVTITIAPPPAPFIVTYSGGAITATYAIAPAAGRTITVTYRYTASGISGALAAGAEQWLELTVDGVAQSPRQKVLAVPFAINSSHALLAAYSETTNEAGLFASTSSLSLMIDQLAIAGNTTSEHRLSIFNSNQNSLVIADKQMPWVANMGLLGVPPSISASASAGWASVLIAVLDNLNCKVAKVKYTATTGSYEGHTEVVLQYMDGSSATVATRGGLFSNQNVEDANPSPSKLVSRIEFRGGNNRSGGGTISYTAATFEFGDQNHSFVSIVQPTISAQKIIVYLDPGVIESNPGVQAKFTVISGSGSYGPFNFNEKTDLPNQVTIDKIRVIFDGMFVPEKSTISKLLLRKIQ